MKNNNNNELLKNIIIKLCDLMKNDPQLSVKLYASLAIGSLFESDVTKALLKGNINNIFRINLTLMEETDMEEILDILQKAVKYFKEESQQYIVELCEYLIKYFKKITSKDDEEDKESLDTYTLISNLVNTFCNFIEAFGNNQSIYPSIEKYIDVLLNYFFKTQMENLENALDIIEIALNNCQKIPNHIWNYFVPLIESVIGSEEELSEFRKEYPNQIFTGVGYESILDIIKIICIYIAKDPNYFITLQDNKGVKYFEYAVKLIENIISISESRSSYSEIKYSLRLINTLFDCYKGKIDMFFEHIIKYILLKYKTKLINPSLESYLRNLLSACFIYDPLKCLKIFQKENCTQDIFVFWFKNLDKLEKMEDLKYNLIGICALISIEQSQQDKLIIDNMKQILEKIYLMTEKIGKKMKERNTDENEDDEYEELPEENEDETEKKTGNQNINELVKNIIEGEPLDGAGNDEDLSYEEEDCDDVPLTNFERYSPIIFVKNTLNNISQKSADIYKIIVESLGDKINKLNEIFNNEEQRLKKKEKEKDKDN